MSVKTSQTKSKPKRTFKKGAVVDHVQKRGKLGKKEYVSTQATLDGKVIEQATILRSKSGTQMRTTNAKGKKDYVAGKPQAKKVHK